MRLARPECLLLSAATGRPREVARLYARAILGGSTLDLQVDREGRDYLAVVREVRWEQLLQEHEFRVAWQDITEHQRFCLLALWAGTMRHSAERTVAKVESALRAAEARWGANGSAAKAPPRCEPRKRLKRF